MQRAKELKQQDKTWSEYLERTLRDATGIEGIKVTANRNLVYVIEMDEKEVDEMVDENMESMKEEDYAKAHPEEE